MQNKELKWSFYLSCTKRVGKDKDGNFLAVIQKVTETGQYIATRRSDAYQSYERAILPFSRLRDARKWCESTPHTAHTLYE